MIHQMGDGDCATTAHCDELNESDPPTLNPPHQSNEPDKTLLEIYRRFKILDKNIDDLLAREDDMSDQEFMSLHEQWTQAVRQAILLTGTTPEGQRAKAAVLRSALNVVREIGPARS